MSLIAKPPTLIIALREVLGCVKEKTAGKFLHFLPLEVEALRIKKMNRR